MDMIRLAGVGVSFDDEPVADDTLDRVAACGDRLDFVKMDAHCGDTDLVTTTRSLADWCHRRGIFLIAKRTETIGEVDLLRSAGVDWAQGHALSHPIPL